MTRAAFTTTSSVAPGPAEIAFLRSWTGPNPFPGTAAVLAAWRAVRGALLAEARAADPPAWPEALFELEAPLPLRRSIFGPSRTGERIARQDDARAAWLVEVGLVPGGGA